MLGLISFVILSDGDISTEQTSSIVNYLSNEFEDEFVLALPNALNDFKLCKQIGGYNAVQEHVKKSGIVIYDNFIYNERYKFVMVLVGIAKSYGSMTNRKKDAIKMVAKSIGIGDESWYSKMDYKYNDTFPNSDRVFNTNSEKIDSYEEKSEELVDDFPSIEELPMEETENDALDNNQHETTYSSMVEWNAVFWKIFLVVPFLAILGNLSFLAILAFLSAADSGLGFGILPRFINYIGLSESGFLYGGWIICFLLGAVRTLYTDVYKILKKR